MRYGKAKRQSAISAAAFTLVEMVVVIAIIAIISGLVIYRLGTFTYWKEESFIRQISETVVFLHHQAVADQAFYRMDFDFDKRSYTIKVVRPDSDVVDGLKDLAQQSGSLSMELHAVLSPSIGKSQTLIPPPSFPSLADPVKLPEEMRFEDVRTMRGKKNKGEAYILFSPRRFSEFAVIHLRTTHNAPVTVLVNPFTGNTTVYREYKDFEWTYGSKKRGGTDET